MWAKVEDLDGPGPPQPEVELGQPHWLQLVWKRYRYRLSSSSCFDGWWFD